MKNLFFYSLTAIALLFASCGDDHMHGDEDGNYEVTISINEPLADQHLMMGEAVHMDVTMEREDDKTIHNVFLEVRDADGNSVMVLDEGHKHVAGMYSYHASDWTPAAAGDYVLYAESTNDDGEMANTAELNMTVHEAATGEYPVAVTVHAPEDGATVAINEAMTVTVHMMHADMGTIHHAFIEVLDANDENVATLLEEHLHEESGTYHFMGDWTPAAAGTYKLRAVTQNHDMSIMKHTHVTFTAE